MAFSPDGSKLLTGSFDDAAKLWNAKTGQLLLTLSGHTSGVFGVWDAETGQPLLTLTGHTLGILDIAISPDGKHLVTSSQDGSIRFYVLPVDELIALAQSRLTRSLTKEECQQFLHMEECSK